MSERSFMENWSLGSDEITWVDCFNLRHDNLDESAQSRLSPEDYRGRTPLIYAHINPLWPLRHRSGCPDRFRQAGCVKGAIVPGRNISVLRLKISLEHIETAPWREIEIRADRTLAHLHDAIQAAFLWYDLHLWQFEIGGRRYELKGQNQGLEPMFGPPVMDAASKKLRFFLESVVPPVIHTYDFGDDWRHRVVPVSTRQMVPDEPLPRFLGGSWATPPEDIGGPPGYEVFREARENPDHPEHDWAKEAGYVDWAPTEIHQDAVIDAFAELQKQRRRAPNPWMTEG